MKFLLLLALFLLIAHLWRSTRHGTPRPLASVARPVPAPSTMQACAHCGVHVPSEDAVPGQNGVYCTSAHRKLREP